jgi:serine/threonine protein phosphatase PrpC
VYSWLVGRAILRMVLLRRIHRSRPMPSQIAAFDGTLPFTAASHATRRGSTHDRNDDCVLLLDARVSRVAERRRGCLFAACDGVSVVQEGRWAAELTCERLAGFFEPDVPPTLDSLLALVNEIDWELRGRGQGKAACTLAALWLAAGRAHFIQVGDTELFWVRDGRIQRMCAKESHSARRLEAYMGMGPGLNQSAQLWSNELLAGDLFLLATDGVTSVLDPPALLEASWNHPNDPDATARAIVAEVERHNGSDDATVIVVDVLASEMHRGDRGA